MTTFFSVCSGIEAASVAWTPLGWQPLGFAEIEKFPSAVLKHHYPDVRNHGDFTRIDTAPLRGRVDVLCGGTPCQAFSVAGARMSLDDARGNLTLAFVGLAHAIQPRNVVWENVPGVLSTKDNAFGCFLGALVGADDALVPVAPRPAVGKSNRAWGWSAKSKQHYVKWPRSGLVTGPLGTAAWRVLDAQYFGLAQRRERVIVVADFGNGADPAAVLFEPEGVRRDSPPSREAGQNVTGTIAARPSGGGEPNGGIAHSLRAQHNDPHDATKGTYIPSLARCVATREGQSQDFESTTMVAVSVSGAISHALAAEGADASEDGTGRGTPIVCFSAKDYGADATLNLSPTLRAGGHTGSHANAGVMPAIAYALGSHAGCADGESTNNSHASGGPVGLNISEEMAYSLRAGRTQSVATLQAVRRLTPRECERLQGFQFLCSPALPGAWQDASGRWWSPDYTLIPIKHYTARKITKNRPAEMWAPCPTGGWWLMAADGPRYKSLGNSWAVPKFAWLGRRIADHMPALLGSRGVLIDLAAVRAEMALRPALAALQMRISASH